MYKAVIFDFDGTLHDSYSRAPARIERILESKGIVVTPVMRETMTRRWGQHGVGFLEDSVGIGREQAAEIYHEWERMDVTHPEPLIEGARETLAWLSSENIAIGMLSSRHRESILAIVEQERLREYFLHITGGDDTPYHKPDARAFDSLLAVFAALGIPKENCLYVGDTRVDIAAGANAGIRTLIVETGPYQHADHRAQDFCEKHVIPSVAHLREWMGRA